MTAKLLRTAGWVLPLVLALLAGCGPTPTPLPSPTASPSATWTPSPTPTRTPTATPTFTPTPTPTPTPAQIGTPFSQPAEGIIELTLPRIVELARWGSGTSSDVAWSPDGRILALATSLGISLYDSHTLEELVKLSSADARLVAFSPDGQILASAGDGLILWDVPSGRQIIAFGTTAAARALDLRFSADGQQIGLVGADGERMKFERWPVDGSEPLESLNIGGEVARITTAVLSPDFSLVAAHGDGPVQLFRTSDGASLTSLNYSPALPGPLAFSPDGNSLAVGYPDQQFNYKNSNEIEVYRMPKGDAAYRLAIAGGVEGSSEALLSLAFSGDGQWLAAGFANHNVQVWARGGGPARRSLQGTGSPNALVFSPDAGQIASSAVDLWSLDTAIRLASAQRNFGPFQDLVLSPDGRLAALAGFGSIELRNVSDGSLVRVIPGLPGPVRGLAFFPGGQTIVAAAGDGLARLYQVSNGRFLSTLGEGGPPLWSVAFSPDSKWLAWGGEGQRIYIYDLEKDTLANKIQEPFVPVRLQFSPDSGMLASLTSSGINVRLLNGQLVRNTGGSGLEDMAFWLDSTSLALAGNDVARMMDINTGKDAVVLDYRPGESPTAVNFTPDGAFMVVGWSSGRLDVFWAGTKDLLRSLQGHQGRVNKIVFSKDGRLMLTYAQDGTVRVWGVTP